MIGYVVPHARFLQGYLGLYADEAMLLWFQQSYVAIVGKKPDMGKSCIRFLKNALIPYMLIAELCGKITVEEWIRRYQQRPTRPKKEKA